nr:hypothetical protein [Tanacetum cinerariifolium]
MVSHLVNGVRASGVEMICEMDFVCYELAEYINTPGWNHPAFYNNGDDDDVDYTIAITPVLSTEEPDNSLSMGDEHLDTIPATKSDEVIKSSVEDLVSIPSESEGIPDTMCDDHLVNNPTPLEAKDHFEIVINSNVDYSSSDDDYLYNENIEYVEASPHDSELVSLEVEKIVIPKDEEIEDDNLREKLLNVNLLITKIKALKDNPTPSFEFLTKSSSTYPKSFLEETNTVDNSLPEFENFCFDLEEISSGSTTTHSDITLSDYEAFSFSDDHIEKISSGSTTTHFDISLSEYDSFIFNFSNDQFPPTDRSDSTHKEFADELAHIISPPKYDCFYFRNLPDSCEWISSLNFGIRENLSSTTRVSLPVEDVTPLFWRMLYGSFLFISLKRGEKTPVTLPQSFLDPRKASYVRLASSGPCQSKGLVNLLYVIKSPQSSMSIACDVIAYLRHKIGSHSEGPKQFCETFHIPDEVHPQLPSANQTIHEIPTGKIVIVIGVAKVSHFDILCRVHDFEPTVGLFRCFYVNSKNKGWMSFSKGLGTDAVCYTKPLDPLKGWNDHFLWVGTFACPALFPWCTVKSVSRDGILKSSKFNAEHYATLVAYPAPFHKYPKPFLCLIGMSHNYSLDKNTYPQFLRNDDEEIDLLSFIWTADPIKVRVDEREHNEGEPKLLETTVGHVVSLLLVSPDHSSSDLEASVDKLLMREGTIAEDVAPAELQCRKRRKTKVVDAGEPSHLAKKLRGDYEVLGVPAVGGKSQSAVQRLLTRVVQHAEVRGMAIPTLPFVSSFVSTTPEREGGDYTEFLAGANLRTLEAPKRFVISSDSSDPLGVNIAEDEVDYVRNLLVLRYFVVIFLSRAKISGDFSDRTGGDFLVGGIRTVVDPDSNLQRVYVPHWNVTNEFCMDDGGVCREMVDEFAPPNFFASIRRMEHDQLFTEFNVGAARQISLGAKVQMRAKYNIKEKRRLKSVVEEKDSLLKS